MQAAKEEARIAVAKLKELEASASEVDSLRGQIEAHMHTAESAAAQISELEASAVAASKELQAAKTELAAQSQAAEASAAQAEVRLG